MITLKEELELAGDYFQIQKYRYGSSISIRYKIASEDLYSCMVHRFSLQPLIENALFHGLEPKRAPGTITVSASSEVSSEATLLILSVTDDGIGMTKEMIEKVPYEAPTFLMDREVQDFYQFTTDDLIVENYETWPQIKNIPIAV